MTFQLSIVIPAHNEEGSVEQTVRKLYSVLSEHNVDHEIVVVNDHSRDNTESILKKLSDEIPSLRYYNNDNPGGFGYAVRFGLDRKVIARCQPAIDHGHCRPDHGPCFDAKALAASCEAGGFWGLPRVCVTRGSSFFLSY